MAPAAPPEMTLSSSEKFTNMSWKRQIPGHVDGTGIEYLDGLYSYAMVLTHNQAEAEDLVHETYVRATQAIGRLSAGSNTKGSLFTILRNIWLSRLRRVRSAPQIVEMEAGNAAANSVVEPSKNSHDLYVNTMKIEQVRAALQELPVESREIIVLREYEALSYKKIASMLDCPIGTVMSSLGRARAKLRMLLPVTLKAPDSSETGDTSDKSSSGAAS